MRAHAWEAAGSGGLAARPPLWRVSVYLLAVASALGGRRRDGKKDFPSLWEFFFECCVVIMLCSWFAFSACLVPGSRFFLQTCARQLHVQRGLLIRVPQRLCSPLSGNRITQDVDCEHTPIAKVRVHANNSATVCRPDGAPFGRAADSLKTGSRDSQRRASAEYPPEIELNEDHNAQMACELGRHKGAGTQLKEMRQVQLELAVERCTGDCIAPIELCSRNARVQNKRAWIPVIATPHGG